MSLFEWSTPERQRGDQILPVIPNEIYLDIFEHIPPFPTRYLMLGELRVFINLSCVCRLFANFCLPRVFEFVEFSGFHFCDDPYARPPNTPHDLMALCGADAVPFCTRIAAKQPLALALAKCVRICRFTDWKLDDTGSWATRLFAEKYIPGLLHMRNIRELRFSSSSVDTEHWRAITTLESLEVLSFDRCKLLQGCADFEPETGAKVRVSRLEVMSCTGHHLSTMVIDLQYLRTLVADFTFICQVDWLPQSALTEILVFFGEHDSLYLNQYLYLDNVHTILVQAPQSVKTLHLPIDIESGPHHIFRSMFDNPVWKNLPLLHSLILQPFPRDWIPLETRIPQDVLSDALDGITLLTGLQSFTLDAYLFMGYISPASVRRVLHDKLGPASGLTYVDIYDMAFRLVDGEWSEVARRDDV